LPAFAGGKQDHLTDQLCQEPYFDRAGVQRWCTKPPHPELELHSDGHEEEYLSTDEEIRALFDKVATSVGGRRVLHRALVRSFVRDALRDQPDGNGQPLTSTVEYDDDGEVKE
jgi:hypothetical protein